MNYFISYVLLFIAFLITIIAQIFVWYSYKKYSKVPNDRGITGYTAARYILDNNDLKDVSIGIVNGYLSDYYDAKKRIVNLSKKNYYTSSIASVSIAMHEAGHALQDKDNYIFMRVRASLIKVVNYSTYAGYIAIILGILFSYINLIWVGIICECIILLFQLVTLPVEIDASKRALKELDYAHFLSSKELKKGRVVLTSAALTYVASVCTSLIEILRLTSIFIRKGKGNKL